MHSLVLEQTESDLSKIKWLCGVILVIPIVLVPWEQVSIVSHSYQTYFGFPGSDFILRCGLRDHVITSFASGGIRARIRNKVISFYYFRFLSVFLKFFSVCIHSQFPYLISQVFINYNNIITITNCKQVYWFIFVSQVTI